MKYIVFVLSFCLCQVLLAQKQKTIVLKNGNKFIGAIMRQDSNKLVLMGHDLNTYVFDTSEVSEITNSGALKLPSTRMKSGTVHDIALSLNSFLDNTIVPYGFALDYAFEKVFLYRHSIGAEFLLFVNDGIYPTLGLKYRYEILPQVSTPYITIKYGNYYEPGWGTALGNRIGYGIGYQFGRQAQRRFYVQAEFHRATSHYLDLYNRPVKFIDNMLNLGFGWRL